MFYNGHLRNSNSKLGGYSLYDRLSFFCLQFKVHKTLLSLAVPQMDWSQSPAQLVGLPEDVLRAILHYLYSESLPRGLSEETAKACVKAVRKLPGFSKFVQLCEQFLKNTALRQRK